MKRINTPRKSPYFYTAIEWSQMKPLEKRKYAKALVYDFLKKKRVFDFIHNHYTRLHGNKPFKKWFNDSFENMIQYNVLLRNYFFDSRVMFDWESMSSPEAKKRMGEIDREWLILVDEEIGR